MTFKSQLTTLAPAPQHCIIVKECIESTITHHFLFIKGFIINFLRPRNTIKYLQNLDTEKYWWLGRLSLFTGLLGSKSSQTEIRQNAQTIFFLSFYHYTKIVIWIYVLQKKLTDTIFEVKKRQTDKRCRVSNSEVVLWTVAQNAFIFVLNT